MTLHLRPSTTMDDRLRIQTRSVTKDGASVPRETYTTADTVWGHLKALSASERVEMAREEHPSTHKARIDPHTSAQEGGRILDADDRAYDISGIDRSGVQWQLFLNLVTR